MGFVDAVVAGAANAGNPSLKKMVSRTPMRRGTYPANQEQDLSGVTTNAAGQQVIRGRGGNEQALGAAAQRRLAAQPKATPVAQPQPAMKLKTGEPLQAPPEGFDLSSIMAESAAPPSPGTAGAVAALSKNPTFQAQLASLGDAQLAAGEGGGGAPAAGITPGTGTAGRVATALGNAPAGKVGLDGQPIDPNAPPGFQDFRGIPGNAQADPTKMVTAPPGGGITDFMNRNPAAGATNAGLFNPAQSGIRDRLRQMLARRRGGTAAPTDEVMKQIPPQIPRTPGPGGVARGVAAY